MDKNKEIILKVNALKVLNPNNRIVLNNINFELISNSSIGIIGKNGVGKSTMFSTLTGINKNFKIINGNIMLNNVDVTNFNEKEWEQSLLRKNFISQVFQNPSNSFNPNRKIIQQFYDIYKIHHQQTNKNEVYEIAYKKLKDFKISKPHYVLNQYPFQLSNGVIQKIVIALILSTNAKLILFDEPISNMDLISKEHIVEIILRIRKETDISFMIISHDIDFLSKVCDEIIVMKEGRIIEQGSTKEIIYNSKHPYSWDLLKYNPYFSSSYYLERTKPFYEKLYKLNIDNILFPPKVKINPEHIVYSWLYTSKYDFKIPEEIKKIFN